ncbi:MAG: GNAT family N-acetyltransferase [Casimicrobiaceae bacterium]
MLTQTLPLSIAPESIALPDGRHVTVRPITPASKPLIAAAMTRLSPESIRRRFFAPRRELSELELHRLTAMDGWNQYALGACTRADDGTLEGIGVARFARISENSTTAELAITVVDAWQGRGIGRALVGRLVNAAALRGIRELHAIVLPDNAAMIGLLQRFAPWARWRRDGDNLMAVIPLPAEPVALAALG